ncbi:uncharacterized protein [Rutidosis leptorrhynchoides]|uniref:uncharacterized protein n=1 Tax=Rutidosis leptorrhynchoides TaxID=125765 RepID=UPI003A9A4F7A
MKALIKNLPTLTAPIAGETLIFYLAIAREAVSLVLIAERDGVQTPIYFVSKALTESELNYRPIEKFVYALMITARRLRSSVKGQILAYYLAETTSDMPITPDSEGDTTLALELWESYTNCANGPEGAGACLLLIGPNKEEHTYALRFNFKAINNEAEYEALLAGIRLTKEIGVKKLQAYVDSQLVANKINGTFDAHDEGMQAYITLPRSLINEVDD